MKRRDEFRPCGCCVGIAVLMWLWASPVAFAQESELSTASSSTSGVRQADASTDEGQANSGDSLRSSRRGNGARQEAFEAGIDEVRQSGILKRARGVGDRAVDFDLPLANGSQLRLNELLSVGPVVLVFYRGGWCPYCNRHLAALQKSLEEIQSLDAQLVAITPELPEKALATQEKGRLAFPIVSDEGNKVAREYGLVFRISDKVIPYYDGFFDIEEYNGDRSYELPLAATYVIDAGGVIRYAFLDADYKARAEPKEILATLQRLKSGGRAPSASE